MFRGLEAREIIPLAVWKIPFPVWKIPFSDLKINFETLGTNEKYFVKEVF